MPASTLGLQPRPVKSHRPSTPPHTSDTNTALTNVMSYAPDTCQSGFTTDQISRMHCYLDRCGWPFSILVVPSLVLFSHGLLLPRSFVDAARLSAARPMGPVLVAPYVDGENILVQVTRGRRVLTVGRRAVLKIRLTVPMAAAPSLCQWYPPLNLLNGENGRASGLPNLGSDLKYRISRE